MSPSSNINPFTAPACKISRQKSAHIHACKQYIWWSYNKSTFNTVQFHRNLFTCSCEGRKKSQWFQIWHFHGVFSEWRCGKCGSERVNTANDSTGNFYSTYLTNKGEHISLYKIDNWCTCARTKSSIRGTCLCWGSSLSPVGGWEAVLDKTHFEKASSFALKKLQWLCLFTW